MPSARRQRSRLTHQPDTRRVIAIRFPDLAGSTRLLESRPGLDWQHNAPMRHLRRRHGKA